MKTMLKKLALIALAALMVVSLVSCDKSNAVKKAFEKADYKVSTVDSDDDLIKGLLATLDEEQKKAIAEYELILAQKGVIPIALIVKFPAAGDLKAFLTVEKDGKKDTSAYDKAKEEGYINGNCWILTLSSDAKDIFAKA